MKRNTSRLLLACLGAIALMIFTAGFNPVKAQNPSCCDYIINTSLVPAACFPISIVTTWSNGQTDVVTVTAPGYFTRHFPFPCPPAPLLVTFTWASAGGCSLTGTSNYCGGCLFITIV